MNIGRWRKKCKKHFILVGASRDPRKYGYKVYAVNPNAEKILGDKCYPNLKNLPLKPEVVNVMVPSKVTEQIVETCKKLGITKVWMRPGSESEKAIKFYEENGIDVVYGVCVMIERANIAQTVRN